MATSLEKISAGLAQHRNQNFSVTISSFAGAPASLSDLNTLAELSDRRSKRLKEFTDGIIKAVATFEAKRKAELAQVGFETTDSGVRRDTLGDNKRRKILSDDVRKHRRDALAMSAENRAKLVAELRDARAKAAAVADLWKDPVAVLMRLTIGSGKRSSYLRQVEHAGPAELENLLRHAVLTSDRDLAAACFSRMDAMAKSDRESVRVERSEVAKALVVEEWTAARAYLAGIEIAHESADVANDSAEGKTISSRRKIALGIRRQELAALLGEDDSTTSDDQTGAPDPRSLEQRLREKYPAVPGSGAS